MGQSSFPTRKRIVVPAERGSSPLVKVLPANAYPAPAGLSGAPESHRRDQADDRCATSLARPRTISNPTVHPTVGRPLRGGEGMAPPQARKAREVAVGRDELASVLDGQGRDVGIRHQRPLDVATQAGEELPVPAARRDERSARPIHEALTEGDGRVPGARSRSLGHRTPSGLPSDAQ